MSENNFREIETYTEGTKILSIYKVKSNNKEDDRTPYSKQEDDRENITYLVLLDNLTFFTFALLAIYDHEDYCYANKIEFEWNFFIDEEEDINNYIKDFFEERGIKINEFNVIKNNEFNLRITNIENNREKDDYGCYLDIYKINLIQDDNEKKEIIIDEYGIKKFGDSYSPQGYFETNITGILEDFFCVC